MKLSALLKEVKYVLLQGSIDCEVGKLTNHSRLIEERDVFFCVSGYYFDGHDFATDAVLRGACVVVLSRRIVLPKGITSILVEDVREALSWMAAAYYDYPARKLTTIGITGTKGKTTTAYMIRTILEQAGYRTGLIGTIETIIGTEHMDASNTTPDSLLVQEYLAKMVSCGCQFVVMEVSSQGLKQRRVAGILFDYAIFTNLSSDHIGAGEHATFEEYLQCKAMLFQQCKIAIMNKDDPYYKELLTGSNCKVYDYSVLSAANLCATAVELTKDKAQLGVSFQLNGMLKGSCTLWMPGTFNIYNALAASLTTALLGVDVATLQQSFCSVNVKGRLELVPLGTNYTVLIDYAHNAVSLESVLKTLREYEPTRLVCLFGCGGNRSLLRRYEMGEISSHYADFTIVTSDNPRDEQPEAIMEDILIGVKKGPGEYVTICDRREAIRYCLENAREGDVILLAGKGHETYQEIKGKKYPMDERDIIKEIRKQD